jgi:hypothetical protein
LVEKMDGRWRVSDLGKYVSFKSPGKCVAHSRFAMGPIPLTHFRRAYDAAQAVGALAILGLYYERGKQSRRLKLSQHTCSQIGIGRDVVTRRLRDLELAGLVTITRLSPRRRSIAIAG